MRLPHETIGDAEAAWARAFVTELEPHHAGVCLNFLDSDDHDRTTAPFAPSAYARLLDLQRRFDRETAPATSRT